MKCRFFHPCREAEWATWRHPVFRYEKLGLVEYGSTFYFNESATFNHHRSD